jgi:integrase
MHTHGIGSYTPDVGMKYYKTYLVEHDVGVSQQKAVLTTIRRFNTFFAEEEFVIQQKHTIELLPGEYESTMHLFKAGCHKSGNKEITVRNKSRFLRQFLKDCIALGCTSTQNLNSSHVTKACLKVKNKDSWAVIRAFLTMMHSAGNTEFDLSTLVPHRRQTFRVPTTYSREEILKVEKAIDRFTGIGKRDYAMILLASRTGLRSCDIVNLTLDDLDFDNDRLRFSQQKTGEVLDLPLIPEIKEALEQYICNGRPETSESRVFIRHHAPYQGITTSVVRFETSRYFRSAGIDIRGKKHGPHTFRSSLASSMVNSSIPYEAVRRILGHRDPDAIKCYAKLDIENLRQCAIEVPVPSGRFKEFLDGGRHI